MKATYDTTICRRRKTCRACGGDRFGMFLSLGPTPLANSFVRRQDGFESEPWFPLDVYLCEGCSLVQLLDVIDPEVLFRNYIYVTGMSETTAAHNRKYARTLVDMLQLGRQDLVAEVASNDGSLLRCFKECGVRTLGIEPATNIAETARAGGIETVNRFFNSAAAREIRQEFGPARVVAGNNVLAHVDDTRDFLNGCKELLAARGLVVIEVPYVRDMINRLEFDTIYHEHLCYFSVAALLRLCEAVGLRVARMDYVPIHGGSLRMYAGHSEEYPEHAPEVIKMVDEEEKAGFNRLAKYQDFGARVQTTRQRVVELLEDLRAKGRTVAGYGAPAKGSTFLNYCRIDSRLLAFTVDRNPMKVGLFTPGTHIPVLPVSALLERQPDYLLVLAWNLADEVIMQQEEYRKRGGRFIIPIPEPKLI